MLMPSRAALSTGLGFALLLCGCAQNNVENQPLQIPASENIVAHVSDSGDFFVRGGFLIQQWPDGAHVRFQLTGLARGSDVVGSFGYTLLLTRDQSRSLIAGTITHLSGREPDMIYPLNEAEVVRPVQAIKLVLDAGGMATLTFTLGTAYVDQGTLRGTAASTATVVVHGVIGVGCGIMGPNPPTTMDPGGLPPGPQQGISPIADPMFSSTFCQTALAEYGLSPLRP